MPDEQNVIDRSGSDLNVAVYQSRETSRDIHLKAVKAAARWRDSALHIEYDFQVSA